MRHLRKDKQLMIFPEPWCAGSSWNKSKVKVTSENTDVMTVMITIKDSKKLKRISKDADEDVRQEDSFDTEEKNPVL